MISIKHLAGLILCGLLVVSCAPYPPGGPVQPAIDPASVPEAPKVTKKPKKKIKKRINKKTPKKVNDAREDIGSGSSSSSGNSSGSSTTNKTTSRAKKKSKYFTAKKIPGKPGFVFNPFTNGQVDVAGVPSGSLIRDKSDPNPNHKFRVP